jgi:hypothetical protein
MNVSLGASSWQAVKLIDVILDRILDARKYWQALRQKLLETGALIVTLPMLPCLREWPVSMLGMAPKLYEGSAAGNKNVSGT